ncbi:MULTISPECIES: glycerophosphoryl diester phosphodiesterase membrane domain-containing protein [unclassified Sphingomonas]|uniref:glycerophosphoryl diester phosphodiesterase membrane domain-containing protein n=1 Tax=unclassified Sphingomonas TaxID=196159 RepID=UPI00044D1AFE|nr:MULTISPECIES: glycerophosphoryl diester phosphodiesterase membrane domain-containing protein [unclassified Sphingomonas]EZP54724.1 putative membrane protein [Sphingomonas sp. RIT328]
MVKMGNVWDRSVAVLDGRGGMLAGVAALTLFVPQVIAAAYTAYAAPSTAKVVIAVVIQILVTVAALWGQLVITAAASDPALDRPAAGRLARVRFGPALLVALVLALAFSLLFLPAALLFSYAGIDVTHLGDRATPVVSSPGAAGAGGLYTVVMLIVVLFVAVRFLPLYAVVLHERLGLGAIARSWRLTRRHTWRLIGAVLLFLIVLLVATMAAQSVSGLVLRLALGADSAATVGFLSASIAQGVSTALTLMAIVFSAQLYVALVAREQLLRDKAARTWTDV